MLNRANPGAVARRGIQAAGVVFGGALLIGLTLVSFPASSSYLKSLHGFSDQQYGSIFLPQLVFAILGALGSAAVVKRLSLKAMYLGALISFAFSQAGLGLSPYLDGTSALWAVMTGTALFGFGFGFGGGPLNGIVSLLYPARTGSALTLLHMMAGLGLTVGPVLFAAAIGAGRWVLVPAALCLLALAQFALTCSITLPGQVDSNVEVSTSGSPARSGYFWVMMLIAVLYALSEGTLANWCVIYLQEVKEISAGTAATALAVFWAGITAGRLLASLIVSRAGPFLLWLSLPPLMVLAFLVIPHIDSSNAALAAFGFAGLACSAFFPLLVTVASAPFPASVSFIASMLTAALMVGVGAGSYGIGVLKGSMSMDDIYAYSAFYPLVALVLILFSRRLLAGGTAPT